MGEHEPVEEQRIATADVAGIGAETDDLVYPVELSEAYINPHENKKKKEKPSPGGIGIMPPMVAGKPGSTTASGLKPTNLTSNNTGRIDPTGSNISMLGGTSAGLGAANLTKPPTTGTGATSSVTPTLGSIGGLTSGNSPTTSSGTTYASHGMAPAGWHPDNPADPANPSWLMPAKPSIKPSEQPAYNPNYPTQPNPWGNHQTSNPSSTINQNFDQPNRNIEPAPGSINLATSPTPINTPDSNELKSLLATDNSPLAGQSTGFTPPKIKPAPQNQPQTASGDISVDPTEMHEKSKLWRQAADELEGLKHPKEESKLNTGFFNTEEIEAITVADELYNRGGHGQQILEKLGQLLSQTSGNYSATEEENIKVINQMIDELINSPTIGTGHPRLDQTIK